MVFWLVMISTINYTFIMIFAHFGCKKAKHSIPILIFCGQNDHMIK